MTKSELIKNINLEYPNLTHADIEYLVNLTLRIITESLSNNERIELRGFGIFKLRRFSKRKQINPLTGDIILKMHERYIPKFKLSRKLKAKL